MLYTCVRHLPEQSSSGSDAVIWRTLRFDQQFENIECAAANMNGAPRRRTAPAGEAPRERDQCC